MKEIYKIFEKNYAISNYGNIKNLSTKRELKFRPSNRGYLKTNISVERKLKTVFPHRLVAQNFIPNPNNLPCVNHIDGNKLNNCIDNLEWCTYKENSQHALKTGLRTTKKVIQIAYNGEVISKYANATEASIMNNCNRRCIYRACQNFGKVSYMGCYWKYE